MSELLEEALKEEREEARAEALAEGRAEGKAEGMQELLRVVKDYKMGNITKENAAKKLNITLEDFNIIAK